MYKLTHCVTDGSPVTQRSNVITSELAITSVITKDVLARRKGWKDQNLINYGTEIDFRTIG